jgi:hypothetical protein
MYEFNGRDIVNERGASLKIKQEILTILIRSYGFHKITPPHQFILSRYNL